MWLAGTNLRFLTDRKVRWLIKDESWNSWIEGNVQAEEKACYNLGIENNVAVVESAVASSHIHRRVEFAEMDNKLYDRFNLSIVQNS